LSGCFHLHLERSPLGRRLIGKPHLPHACGRQAGTWAHSGLVVLMLWLALGLATTPSWAQSTASDAGRVQSGNAKAGRNAQKAEDTPSLPSGMSYTTDLDRTAIWVGDEFHYVITVDYSSEFEFVLDNLNKEDVNMDPFTVVNVAKKTTPLSNNKTRLLLDITLANYSLNQTEAHIPQLSLYYFRRDQHTTSAEQAAAESLMVSGPSIGLRSTLPPNPADIRDSTAVIRWERLRWVVPAVSLVALTLLIAWLGWEAYLFLKKRSTTQGPDHRISMEAVRARWASGVPSDFSDSQATREFFDRSYQNLKEYLGYYLGTNTASLTAEEVKEEMRRSGASTDVTEKVGKALATCEAVRYSGDGITANGEAARSVARDVREILSLGPKD
jgi:hypothetical protein